MRMKNGEILELYSALQNLWDNKDFVINIKAGYALKRNLEILRPEIKIIQDLYKDIVLKYGQNVNGNINIPPENIDAANKEINDLMEIDNPVQIQYVDINLFKDNETNIENIKGLIHMIKETQE